jgi:hypothetical protein
MRRLVPLLLMAAILLVAVPCQVDAQEGISVSQAVVEVDFPRALTFSVSAQSSSDIDRIVLRYRVQKISTARVTSLVLMDFEQARAVEASWKWDMRKSGLPPGAEVRYSWRIDDVSGQELRTDWEVVHFDDSSHSWTSMTEGNVTLLWYYGGQTFSRELMDSAQEGLDRLANDTGAYLDQDVKLYVYANSSDLGEAMVYPQEWMGGITFSEFGIVAIGVSPEDLAWGKRILKHELAHLVTYQMTANPYGDIPTWLSEGLSMYAEGELEASLGELLAEAVSEDRLFSARTLSSEFPADPQAAYLSYAQSFSLVDYLVTTYGREEILRLLDTFKLGATYDDALTEVYGFDTDGLNAAWRASLGLRTSPLPPQTPEEESSPTVTPGSGFLDCSAASSARTHGGGALFGVLGLLLLPGTGEAIRLMARRGRR